MSNFTFKFSQTSGLRQALSNVFFNQQENLARIAQEKHDLLQEQLHLTIKPALAEWHSQVLTLESKLAENEKLIRRKQAISKVAKKDRPLLIQEYKLARQTEQELEASHRNICDQKGFWQTIMDIQKAIDEGETIFAIGIFASVMNAHCPFSKIWGQHTGYKETDVLMDLTRWADEKITAYCLGYVAMAKTNNDILLDGLNIQQLVALANLYMPKHLAKQYELISQYADKFVELDTYPNLAFRYAVSRQFHPITEHYSNASFADGLRKEYQGKDKTLVESAIQTGIASFNEWWAFPMFGCYAAIIAQLEKPVVKLEQQSNAPALPSGLYSTIYDAYPNMDKQALKVASELYLNREKDYIRKSLKAFNGKSTWDSALDFTARYGFDKKIACYTDCKQWITNAHALYNVSAIKEQSLAKFIFSTSKSLPSAKPIIDQVKRGSYQNLRVLGTRRNNGDNEWLTYFTTDTDNCLENIVVVNYGYIKLLESFHMPVARIVLANGLITALSHQDEILAVICGMRQDVPQMKEDRLSLEAFNAVLSFYEQANGNANHPSNKHLLVSAKVA